MKVVLPSVILLILHFNGSLQTSTTPCPPAPNTENLQNCCDVPTLTRSPHYATCLSKHGYEGHIPNNCVAGCFITETKILVNNSIDVKVLKEISQQINNGLPEWDQIISNSVKSCIAPLNISTIALDRCDLAYVKLAKCIFQTNFANCPDQLYRKSPECDALKQHSEECFNDHDD